MAYRDQKRSLEERISVLEGKLAAATTEKRSLQQELAAARNDLAALQPPPKKTNKRGLAIGLSIMGFGFSGLVFLFLFRAVI